MDRLTFSEMAERVTNETLPELFHLLHSRPKPHDATYEILILEQIGETLNMKLWTTFIMYQDTINKKLSGLTEMVWQRSFPDWFNLNIPEPKMGIIYNFPEDHIQKKKRGRKPNSTKIREQGEIINNVIKLQKLG